MRNEIKISGVVSNVEKTINGDKRFLNFMIKNKNEYGISKVRCCSNDINLPVKDGDEVTVTGVLKTKKNDLTVFTFIIVDKVSKYE